MISIKDLKQMTKNMSVLYIEDEDALRKNMNVYLSKLFGEVTAVSDGDIGLQEYKKNQFDIVITDIYMPNMSGIDMIEEIFKINLKQNIIVITAMTSSVEKLNALHIESAFILTKPVDNNDLIDCIYKVIDKN